MKASEQGFVPALFLAAPQKPDLPDPVTRKAIPGFKLMDSPAQLPREPVRKFAICANANNRFVVSRKLETVTVVSEHSIADTVANGIEVVGSAPHFDFRQRRVHEQNDEACAEFISDRLATIAKKPMRKRVVYDKRAHAFQERAHPFHGDEAGLLPLHVRYSFPTDRKSVV